MSNSPFRPLFGGKGVDPTERKHHQQDASSVLNTPPPRQPQSQPQSHSQVRTRQPLHIPAPQLTNIKQKATKSLGDLALFVDKRKTLIIIVLIILILLAVAIIAVRQEKQRKRLSMMRRRLRRLA